jgi:hypothetical protein
MRSWQVRLVYSRNLGEGHDELAATLRNVGDELAEYSAAVVGGSDGLTVTLVVESPDHAHALDMADSALRQAASGHGVEPGDIVECHAKTWN